MAGRISWSLNLRPLTNSNSPLTKKSQIPCASKKRREEENRSQVQVQVQPWRSKSSLLLRLAASGVIVALQMSDVASVESVVMDFESPVKLEERRSSRWSDKRMCPSWLQNSFEIIVPENLPRPSAHRRLELARLDAPPLGAVVTRADRTGCFSM